MIKSQSGSVLAISLVLLTSITLISIIGLQRSGLQTKIVANLHHDERTFTAGFSELGCTYNALREDTQDLSDAKDLAGEELAFNCTNPRPPLALTNTISLVSNGNALGNPNTSMIRDEKSRGTRGLGKLKFKLEVNASLPNGVDSTQLIGLTDDPD